MTTTNNPTKYIWPGLASYQEEDRHLFYGRSGEIFDLTRKILNSRLTILFGPSGAGKTSLLQAGVFPKLREQNFLPVTIRLNFPVPGEPITAAVVQFESALTRECNAQAITIEYSDNQWFQKRKENISLWEWLRSFTLMNSSGSVCQPIFIFDQFEEVFTLGKNALGLEAFLQQIGDAVENFLPEEIHQVINEENSELPFDPSAQNYKMVISLREDYLAQLQGLRQVLPGVTVRQNHFALVKLNGSQAMEAITGPAPEGIISDRVATEIILFVANASESLDTDSIRADYSMDQIEVEPAILSLICQQLDLKRQAQGQQVITVDFVKQSKGQILEEFYGSAMQAVKPETRTFIEDHLLDAEGFRTSEPESNLSQHQVAQEDILHLIDLRILHRVEFYHRSHLELSHDVLAPVVKASRDNRVQREEVIRRNAEIKLLKMQRRRSAILTAVFACITGCALIAGYFSIQKQREATTEKRKAVALYLVSSSQVMTQKNTDQAICLARLACQIDSSPLSAGNVQKIVYDNGSPLSNVILKGHREMVYSAVFSPDGKMILSASRDSTAKLWDTEGNVIADLKGHYGDVYSAVFSKDGERILTTSADSTARLWDKNGNLITVLKGHKGVVFLGIFSPDGKFILTGSTDETVILWDSGGSQVAQLPNYSGKNFEILMGLYQQSIDFSPDSRLVVTTSINNLAKVWDIKGNLVTELKGHRMMVLAVKFSPDGKQIITSSDDGIVKLWNLHGDVLADFIGSGRRVYNSTFSPDGKQILTTTEDRISRLWNTQGILKATYKGHKNAVYLSVFSPNGKQILTCGDDNTAKLWDLQGNLIADLKGHQRDVITAYFSPDGKNILTASYDRTIKIWNLDGGLVTDLKGHRGSVANGLISKDSKRILTSSYDSSMIVWDLSGKILENKKRSDLKTITGYTSPEWKQVLDVFEPEMAEIYGASRNNLLIPLKSKKEQVITTSFDAQFDRIVAYYDDSSATYCDFKENKTCLLKGHMQRVRLAAFSPDRTKILTAYPDHTCKLWDSDGNFIADFIGHKSWIVSACFSPDGKMILTSSYDYTAKLWDLKGNLITNFTGHVYYVPLAVFSPDGNQVLTACVDNTARLWDLKGNTLSEFVGHQGGLYQAIFAPDGKFVATASMDNTAKVWDLAGRLIADLKGHRDVINSVAFFPDGQKLVTFSADGTAKIWPGQKEILHLLAKNPHREKLNIQALAEIPIELSREDFEAASRDNIVEGTYREYKDLVDLKKK
jgi:WD40 repeat protein